VRVVLGMELTMANRKATTSAQAVKYWSASQSGKGEIPDSVYAVRRRNSVRPRSPMPEASSVPGPEDRLQ
jgi:hypothetical protein